MLKIKGLSKVLFNLDSVKKKLSEEDIVAKLSIATKVVADSARKFCPVRTGELKRSIHATNPKKISKTKYQSEVKAEKFYAIYVELGTRFFKPRAFLQKGLKTAIPTIKSIFSNLGL